MRRTAAAIVALLAAACDGEPADAPDAPHGPGCSLDPVDAAVIDGLGPPPRPIDAPWGDAVWVPGGWPTPVGAPPVLTFDGALACFAAGRTSVATGVAGAAGVRLFLDATPIADGSDPACTIAVTHDGRALFTSPGATGFRVEPGGARIDLAAPQDILAIDPAGGALVVAGNAIHRLRADLTIDPAFAAIPVSPRPGARTVQDCGGGPVVTYVSGSSLVRRDLRTGALVEAFAGGQRALHHPDVLALVPLPELGVAVLTREPNGPLRIERFTATGARTEQEAQLFTEPVALVPDTGSYFFAVARPSTNLFMFTRYDAATGERDLPIGDNGSRAYHLEPWCPAGTTPAGDAPTHALSGVRGDGRIAITTSRTCTGAGGGVLATSVTFVP